MAKVRVISRKETAELWGKAWEEYLDIVNKKGYEKGQDMKVSVEGIHSAKPQTRQLMAPSGCRAGMEIKTCLECKLPDDIGCDEDKGRHWLRDEAIRADQRGGKSYRELTEKWHLAMPTIEMIVRAK